MTPLAERLLEDAVLEGEVSGRLHVVNAAACALTGYRRSELLSMNSADLVAPEWLDFALGQRRRKVEDLQDVTRYQCVFVTKDGTRVPVEVTSTLLKERGEVVGIRAVVTDLRRPTIERRLEESEERWRGAFEGAAIGMAVLTPDGRWLRVNDAMPRLLGYSREQLLGRTMAEVTHPDDLPRDEEAMRDLLAGRVSWYQMKKRYVRADGGVLWGLLAMSLVRDANGSAAYVICQISDITAAEAAEHTRRAILPHVPTGPPKLSAREREVVIHLSEGMSSGEVARLLGIAEGTVETLVKRAMRKRGARTRTQLVATALRLGDVT